MLVYIFRAADQTQQQLYSIYNLDSGEVWKRTSLTTHKVVQEYAILDHDPDDEHDKKFCVAAYSEPFTGSACLVFASWHGRLRQWATVERQLVKHRMVSSLLRHDSVHSQFYWDDFAVQRYGMVPRDVNRREKRKVEFYSRAHGMLVAEDSERRLVVASRNAPNLTEMTTSDRGTLSSARRISISL